MARCWPEYPFRNLLRLLRVRSFTRKHSIRWRTVISVMWETRAALGQAQIQAKLSSPVQNDQHGREEAIQNGDAEVLKRLLSEQPSLGNELIHWGNKCSRIPSISFRHVVQCHPETGARNRRCIAAAEEKPSRHRTACTQCLGGSTAR